MYHSLFEYMRYMKYLGFYLEFSDNFFLHTPMSFSYYTKVVAQRIYVIMAPSFNSGSRKVFHVAI